MSLFIGWHRIYAEVFLMRRLLTDFRRGDLFGRCRYPLRLEKVPQISQIYTDFSWDVFLVTQISQMTQIFFIHRMTRNLFGGIPDKAITHGFSRRRPVRSVQIPPGIGICPTKKNLCISVKSVGRNNPHEEKSASSAKSAWQKQQEHISGASHWPAAKYPRNSVSNPISKNASRFIREIRWKKWRNEKGVSWTPWHTLFRWWYFS